jgi:hypothetical protein
MKKITILYSLLVVLFASSCIKEKYKVDYDDNTRRIITEFTDAKNEVNTLALDYKDQFIETDLTELQIFRSDFNTDVQVKVALNKAVVDNYNSEHPGEEFESPPAGSFNIVSTDLVISPATRKTKVRIRIKPSAIAGGAYAIGLSIAQVSQGEISPIYKNILIEVKVKNDYEGSYAASGLRILYAGTTNQTPIANQFDIEGSKYLYTIDLNTVEAEVADLGAGAWMYLEIDPTTHQVTVLPSDIGPSFPSLQNDGPCTYDPATKTFELKYKYFNAAGNLREITETLVLE